MSKNGLSFTNYVVQTSNSQEQMGVPKGRSKRRATNLEHLKRRSSNSDCSCFFCMCVGVAVRKQVSIKSNSDEPDLHGLRQAGCTLLLSFFPM
eukprot:223784-Amphidinium_carterae.1